MQLWVWALSFAVSASAVPVCLNFNDGCTCSRPNKGLLDLRRVGLRNGSARFQNVKGRDGILYSYNPCFPFTVVEPSTRRVVDSCREVAICARNGSRYETTATEMGAKFEFDHDRRDLFVKYHNPEKGDVSTRVYMKCGTKEELRVVSWKELYLYSPCVCPGGCRDEGLSPGSILLLIFFSCLMAYLVIGCLVNKAFGEATGRQLVPNYSFWSELPALVKDGYMFFLSPCLGDRVSYSNAYQNI